MTILGVIGGSGVYDLPGVWQSAEPLADTPFGLPSGPVVRGLVGQTELLFLARHGVGHQYSPTTVPYRANIYALKQLGATHLLSLSAVGSLREELPPGPVSSPIRSSTERFAATIRSLMTASSPTLVLRIHFANNFASR